MTTAGRSRMVSMTKRWSLNFLWKREEARIVKERVERQKEIQDKAKALVRMLEDKDTNAHTNETASDDHTAHPDHSVPPVESAEMSDDGDDVLVFSDSSEMSDDGDDVVASTESENITGPLQHTPGNGSTPEQQQLTTPEEALVSAAVGPSAAKLLGGIESIKKLSAANAEYITERSVLMADSIKSLKRDATEHCTQNQAVLAALEGLDAVPQERYKDAEREREVEWASAVSKLQTRNDRLAEELNNANTRASAVQAQALARQATLEAELISWQRYFEMRSLRFDISRTERAHGASAVDAIQKAPWPGTEAVPSSTSSVVDGAHTPSTVTTDLSTIYTHMEVLI
ncbi:hypothetical protein BZA05DRAFT_263649 [Tricharina praecox]|uniref:uncharacterized protein n=1 Tax=Tricharina praecox TaxID=43433 RepID=UPI00221FB5C4|nr:uncharacterized protein BZA05DRAFT_263649 [Tricharina praecox]KAI5854357.1 hypothetical protein BZA05DRAFT_263649 [Tricharina praecox]